MSRWTRPTSFGWVLLWLCMAGPSSACDSESSQSPAAGNAGDGDGPSAGQTGDGDLGDDDSGDGDSGDGDSGDGDSGDGDSGAAGDGDWAASGDLGIVNPWDPALFTGEPEDADAGVAANETPPRTNPFVLAEHDPFATFAVDVDTASYDALLRDLRDQKAPVRELVRL